MLYSMSHLFFGYRVCINATVWSPHVTHHWRGEQVEVQKLLAEMIKSQELMLEIRWDFGGRISCFSRGWVNLPSEVERFASRKVTEKTQQKRLVFQALFDLAAMLSFGRVSLQIEMWT